MACDAVAYLTWTELGRRGLRGESGGRRWTQAATGVGRAGYVGGVLSLEFVEVIRRQRIIWARWQMSSEAGEN